MRIQTTLAILAMGASLAAGVVVAMFQAQEHRTRAQIEIEVAHSELEIALRTLTVRMTAMAVALERAASTSPAHFGQVYAEAAGSGGKINERAIAFMPELTGPAQAADLAARFAPEFEAADYPPFAIFPEDDTGAVFPAIFVEPPSSRPNVFGYNMGSSPERLAAARDALARGAIAVSAPVVLTQDQDASRVSFLMLYPVYLPDADSLDGVTRGVLGASLTPLDLFTAYMQRFDRFVVQIDLGIGGAILPITLGVADQGWLPHIPVARDLSLQPIAPNEEGLRVTFQASAHYIPRLFDLVLPLSAMAVTGLIFMLLINFLTSREQAQRRLETALALKEADLRQAYQVQARSQRLEALGRLVGGVAHDFNNILSVILGNLELMKEENARRMGDPLINEAVKATHRGAHLTRQLLAVGRKSHLQPERISVASALGESTDMLSRVLPASIELSCVPAAGLWPIHVDPNGLQSAILNLSLNARDAMDGRGKLILEASNTRASQDYIEDRPEEEITPGRFVMISITDTGPGMAPEVVDRAFEPFFTTKRATDGSGLGLPSVLGFCRQSGGTCRIYTELGVGTTMKMYFPAGDPSAAGTPVSDRAAVADAPGGGADILLAEDEAGVARVMQQQLEAAGYSVTWVASGDAALMELESGARYDLLVSDLVMPGHVQGAELAKRVERLWPEMGILLVSGYPQEAAIEGNGVASRHPVITKPVARTDLLRAIQRILARPA